MNTYVITNARLVADPETKTFGDRQLTELRVADNPMKKQDRKGNEAIARFVTLKLWGAQAEAAAKLRKGDVIVPTGELGIEQYTNNKGELVSKDVMTVYSYAISKSESFFEKTDEVPAKKTTRAIPF